MQSNSNISVQNMNKEQIKTLLLSSSTRILGTIANGIVHRTPKQVTLRLVKKEIAYCGRKCSLNLNEINDLWLNSYRQYMQISKKTYAELRRADYKFGPKENYEENLKQRMEILYKTVQKSIIQPEILVKERNLIANSLEFREKHDKIWGNEGIFSAKTPFFLASSHANPAKDHKDWEGRMYYDEAYRDYCTESEADHVAAIIKQGNLHSAQWVVGEPVYLCTRPNCKHFLIPISLDEASKLPVKTLLKKHNGYMKDEEPMSYEERVLNRLKAKVDIELELSKVMKSESLDKDLSRHRELYRIWSRRSSRNSDRAKMKTNK